MSRRTTLVFGLPLFLALAHCNALFGIDDASLVEGAGGGPAGAGSGGQPQAGTSGVGGVGGVGGLGGSGGAGGRSGQGGADPAEKVQIAAGAEHTCAWAPGSSAYCWGEDLYGQLGSGPPLARSEKPVIVRDALNKPLANFSQLELGGRHTCALLLDKTVLCWGSNGQGQAAADPSLFPSSVLSTPLRGADGITTLGDVQQIALGDSHGCARLGDGSVACWGDNSFGQIGQGDVPTPSYVARTVLDDTEKPLADVQDLAAGDFFTCARTSKGALYCWGSNTFGQLGAAAPPGQTGRATLFLDTNGQGFETATAFALGGFHGCAIATAGRVFCWGSDESGQLGGPLGTGGAGGAGGVTNPRLGARRGAEPVQVLDAAGGKLEGVLALALGAQHSCGVKAGGTVYCWGRNGSGELGNGTTGQASGARPVVVDTDGQLAAGALGLALGNRHSCVAVKGGAYCWGVNLNGQLGSAENFTTETPTLYPKKVEGLTLVP